VFNIGGLHNILIPEAATRNFKNALDYFFPMIEYVGTISHQQRLALHIELSPTDEGLEEFLGGKPDTRWSRICIHYDYFDAPYMDVRLTENCFELDVTCDVGGIANAQFIYERLMTPRREIAVPYAPLQMFPGARGRLKNLLYKADVKFERTLQRLNWRLTMHMPNRERVYEGRSANAEKVEKMAAALFGANYKLGPIDRSVGLHGHLLPNAQDRWPYQRERIMALQMAIDSVCCAPYVILEIYDWLPAAKHFTHKQKIEFIDGVRASIRRVRRLAASTSVADRVKRRSLTKRFAVAGKNKN
jgi:hypothetical protein